MENLEKTKEEIDQEHLKTKFEERINKQYKYSRKIFLSVFLPIGLIFIFFGILFFVITIGEDSTNDDNIMAIIFFSMGGIFILIAILFYFCMPRSYTYETYLKRKEKYFSMYYGHAIIELEAKIELLEESKEELENKVNQLESKLEEYRRRN